MIRENAFEHKKKKPGLSATRPSNNCALSVSAPEESRKHVNVRSIIGVVVKG